MVEKANSQYAVNKMKNSLDVIWKIEAYIGHLGNIVNKTKLFDNNLATNPITAAKVIPMLVDFNQKMENLLDNMQSLLEGLKVIQVLPLETSSSIDQSSKHFHWKHLHGYGGDPINTSVGSKSDRDDANADKAGSTIVFRTSEGYTRGDRQTRSFTSIESSTYTFKTYR